MATENAKIDGNRHKSMLGEKDDGSGELANLLVDPTTKRLKVSAVLTTDFTSLSDTPASYTGEAGKAVVVNGAEDGLEFGSGFVSPVAVVDGGTGATDASTARTNLGIALGSDVQAYDADLDGIAALSPANGDVLYYNSGWNVLAKGLDTEVLTLATGIPSWAAPGGGGPSQYDATVGSTGADYADVQAAITGVGGTDIKLLLITSVTEDSDIAVPNGATLHIDLSNYTLTLGTNQFTNSSAVSTTFIRGNGVDSGAEIDYTPTVANEEMFDMFGSANIVDCEGFVWDNNASADGCDFCDTGILRIRDVRAELPNQANCGFFSSADSSFSENVHFVGGGSSCTNPINGVERVTNARFTGEFASTNTSFLGGVATGIFFDITGTFQLGMTGVLNNVYVEAGTVNVNTNTNDIYIANLDGVNSLDISALDRCRLSNIEVATLDLSDVGIVNCSFINVRVTNAVTVAGDNIKATNCDFLGGLSVSSGADNNGFVNCQFGPDGGGGALTITVDSGSNNTRIVGCMTDAAISDAGTGTVTAANVEY